MPGEGNTLPGKLSSQEVAPDGAPTGVASSSSARKITTLLGAAPGVGATAAAVAAAVAVAAAATVTAAVAAAGGLP